MILQFLFLFTTLSVAQIALNFEAVGSRSANKDTKYTGTLIVDLATNGDWNLTGVAYESNPRQRDQATLLYKEGSATRIQGGKARCVPAADLPPLQELQQAFENNELLERNDIVKECPPEFSFIRIEFVGEDFLVCISKDKQTLHSAYGSQFTVKFETNPNPSIEYPDYALRPCPLTSYKAPKAPEGYDHWWRRDRDFKLASASKACVFIHGSGVREDLNWTTSFQAYWGNLHEFELTPQCKTRKFIHMNTFNHGWDYEPNQKKVCDLILSESATANDTVVFTHSMGGLIFAAAQMNGYCLLGQGSSWYAAAPPTNGSRVANFVDEICKKEEWRRVISRASNICDGTDPAASYYSLANDYPGLAKLHQYMQLKTKGQMCGTSSYGLHSIDSPGLVLLATVTGLSSPNDGLVSWNSCHLDHVYGSAFSDNWYATPTNHADATCRNGDGWWGLDRRPCSWYTNKY